MEWIKDIHEDGTHRCSSKDGNLACVQELNGSLTLYASKNIGENADGIIELKVNYCPSCGLRSKVNEC